MKKIIFTMVMGIGLVSAYAQLKVVASGDTEIRRGLTVGQDMGSNDARIEIGSGRSASGNAYFDLIGNIGYPDFGARLIRLSNGITSFTHRGTNILFFRTYDAAPLVLGTNLTERVRVTPTGSVGIGTDAPTAMLSVNGTANKPGGGDWGMFSDRRLKKNVAKFTDGIEQLMKINPVTYQYNGKANIEDTESTYIGVIAQELEEVAPYMVKPIEVKTIEKSGEMETYEETSRSLGEYLYVDATAIRYMLVNAVKAHQTELEEKENRIRELEEKLNELESKVNDLIGESNEIPVGLSDIGSVGQNAPNPFTNTTIIPYYIPRTSKSAWIDFYDINGKFLKKVTINQFGKGNLNVSSSDLPNGVYTYQLVIDNGIVDAKKMIRH